jgi:hypothetical protein
MSPQAIEVRAERTSESGALREEQHSRGGDTPSAAAGSPVVKDVAARIAGKAFEKRSGYRRPTRNVRLVAVIVAPSARVKMTRALWG